MARKSKEKIIAELTKLGVDFDARESYENLKNQLEIEIRDSKSQHQAAPEAKSEDENLLLMPLSPEERMRLKELERMANMGRKIEQPTPEEMKELGKLRQRAVL